MFELVFTNIRTHMDFVGSCPESELIPLIQSMLINGWFLSELNRIDKAKST